MTTHRRLPQTISVLLSALIALAAAAPLAANDWPAWSAGQATGAPDGSRLGFEETGWAPQGGVKGIEWLELRFSPPIPAAEAEAVAIFAPEDPTSLVGVMLGDEQAVTMRMVPFEQNEVVAPGILRFDLEPTPNDIAVVTLLFDTRRTPKVVPMIDAAGLIRRGAEASAAEEAADSEEPAASLPLTSGDINASSLPANGANGLGLPGGDSDFSPPAWLDRVQWATDARASSSWALGPAKVLFTNPPLMSAEIDAGPTDLVIVFDRDMDTTSGLTLPNPREPFAPPLAADAAPHWRTPRQYVIPVELAEGEFYRLGLGVEAPDAFRTAFGARIYPTAYALATVGAEREVRERLDPPRVAKIDPQLEHIPTGKYIPVPSEVDPSVTEFVFHFSRPMAGGAGLWNLGPLSPYDPEREPFWNEDRTVWTAPVKLQPNTPYAIAINRDEQVAFQSIWGIPVVPRTYRFFTGPGE